MSHQSHPFLQRYKTCFQITTLNLLVNSSNFGASSSESYNGWRHLRQHRRTSPICSITINTAITKSLILILWSRMLYWIIHIQKYDKLITVWYRLHVPDHRVSSQYISDSCHPETFLGSFSSTRQFLLYRLHESQPVSPYQIQIHCTSSRCMWLKKISHTPSRSIVWELTPIAHFEVAKVQLG